MIIDFEPKTKSAFKVAICDIGDFNAAIIDSFVVKVVGYTWYMVKHIDKPNRWQDMKKQRTQ